MKVDLPVSYECAIAQVVANEIHGAVISMHLRLTSRRYNIDLAKRQIRDVRACLGSIPCDGTHYSERRQLLLLVKHYFRVLVRENGTEPRWQDYVAKVRRAHPEEITPECEAKLIASGYIPLKGAA